MEFGIVTGPEYLFLIYKYYYINLKEVVVEYK